jgi:hypothetical protein
MDRYYDIVNKQERLDDGGGDPTVVVLPPENVFWGEPMGDDEMLTYDLAGLPLAVVPRPPMDSEIMGAELLAAGVTQQSLRQAQIADSRGNPVPLTEWNAALDSVVAASTFAEAQFLEQL